MDPVRFVRSTSAICVSLLTVVVIPAMALAQSGGGAATDPALRSYLSGNGLLNRGLHDLAAVEYRKFLEEYSDHDRAPLAHYGLAVCLFRTKDHAGAIEHLTPISDDSDFEFAAEVATMLGQSHLALKKYDPAAKYFQVGARTHAEHALADESAVGATEALYLGGHHDEAAGWAKLVVARWPDSPLRARAEFFGGLAEMARQGYEDAGKRFAGVLERDPDGPFADQSSLLLAQCYERGPTLTDAIRQYHRLLKRDKTRYAPEALLALGVLHRQRGELKESGMALDTLLDRFGQSSVVPRAALLRGRVAFDRGDFNAADEFFNKAGQADDALRDRVSYWRAKCDLRRERFQESESRLTEAIASYPESALLPEMWYDLGITRLRQQSFQPATDALRTFREKFGSHELSADALRLLAMTEHQRRGFDESLEYARLFLKSYPSHEDVPGVAFLAAENDFLTGRYEPAVKRYEDYLSRFAQDAQVAKARLRLGTALHRLGRFDEAQDHLTAVAGHEKDAPVFGSSHLALGDIHFQRSEWKQAEEELRAFLTAGVDQPGADDALIKLGLSLQRQGRAEDAVAVYQTLIDEKSDSPHRIQAIFEKGQALVMLNREGDAEAAFQRVLSDGADTRFAPHALNHLATIAMHRGAFDEADALYGKAAGSASDDELKSGAAYQRIKALMASKRFADAEVAIATYLKQHGSSGSAPAARAQLAIALSRQNKNEEAIEAADRALASSGVLDPSLSSAVQYEKAWCLSELGRSDEAGEVYAQLIKHGLARDYELHALLELAGIESAAKRFQKAVPLLHRIRDSGDSGTVPPDVMAQATYRLGVCEFELGRFGESVSLFEEFLAGAGDDPLVSSAAFYAGESAFKIGQFERAVKHLNRVVEDFPTAEVAAPSLLRLGEAFAQLQQFSGSERVFTAYLDQYGDQAQWYQAQFGVGWARENQQRHDGAMASYRKVIERHQGPTSARAQFQIGECLFAQKKYDEAAAALLKVDILYAYPQWSSAALYEAGRCLVKLNKVAEARRQFEQVSQDYPDSRWATMATQQLKAMAKPSVPGT